MEGTVLTTIPSIILGFLPFCSSLVCSCLCVLFLLGNIAQCHGLLTMLKNISIFFPISPQIIRLLPLWEERERERESFLPSLVWYWLLTFPSTSPHHSIVQFQKLSILSTILSIHALYLSPPPPIPHKGNPSLAAYLSSKSSGPLPLGISNDLLWRGDVNTFCSPLFFSGIVKWAKHMSTKLHTTGDFHLFLSLDYP